MMEFQDIFMLGMKRSLNILLEYEGLSINVGSSTDDSWSIAGTISLGLPSRGFLPKSGWVFPRDKLPFNDASVSTIHCYHFLEHLSGTDAIAFLREAERVMIPGKSVMNFCMPYYNSNLAAECLDHKSQWNENSFRNLFENSGYDIAGEWKLRAHFVMIAGVVERNLCVIGQLAR